MQFGQRFAKKPRSKISGLMRFGPAP